MEPNVFLTIEIMNCSSGHIRTRRSAAGGGHRTDQPDAGHQVDGHITMPGFRHTIADH